MTSEKITVSADVQDLQKALDEAKSFSARSGLKDRQALHLDLLVEETLGMVRAMVSEFQGEIYYENDQSVYRIHLQAKAQVSTQKRRELVSLSTSGKNAAVKGLMSRIGIFLSSAGDSIDEYGAETLNYGIMPIGEIDLPVGVYDMTPLWTLSNYKKVLGQQRADSENAREAWDELEKSIVANIADDVVVGVSRGHIEMIISKDFSKATLPMRERVSSVETPKLWITQNERRVSVANEMAQTFAWHVGLTPRESMHITLLTE